MHTIIYYNNSNNPGCLSVNSIIDATITLDDHRITMYMFDELSKYKFLNKLISSIDNSVVIILSVGDEDFMREILLASAENKNIFDIVIRYKNEHNKLIDYYNNTNSTDIVHKFIRQQLQNLSNKVIALQNVIKHLNIELKELHYELDTDIEVMEDIASSLGPLNKCSNHNFGKVILTCDKLYCLNCLILINALCYRKCETCGVKELHSILDIEKDNIKKDIYYFYQNKKILDESNICSICKFPHGYRA
jgi:hypothetical protein